MVLPTPDAAIAWRGDTATRSSTRLAVVLNSAIIIQLGVVVCKDIILHRAATPNSCNRDILVAMNVRNQQTTLLAQNIQSTMVGRLQLSESRDKLSDLKKHPRTSKLFMIV